MSILEEDDKEKLLASMPDSRKELFKDATLPQIKSYGSLDEETLESMIVGFLVGDPDLDDPVQSLTNADKIVEACVQKEWFEFAYIGELFEDAINYYRIKRKLITPAIAQTNALTFPLTQTQALNYKQAFLRCHAAVLARNIGVDPILDLFVCNHLQKLQDKIYQDCVKERNDPKIGPKKSHENMRNACIRELVDPRGAVLKEKDWISDYQENLNWMKDMKENPEKYRGITCGIPEIDNRTEGFRPGQLTVVVGPNGGFKTTCMLNIAYGCFERGANVLYVSLEMESHIVQLKLWARGAKISWTRCYNGNITEPEDRIKVRLYETLLRGEELDKELQEFADSIRMPKDKDAMQKELQRIQSALSNVPEGREDRLLIEQYQQKMAGSKNKLRILNAGQSQKMKMSQLERYLREQESLFKPNIVVLDYLDLIDPEVSNPNRPDLGIGEVTKASRRMGQMYGFSVVTAAQLKRGAIERIRKTGMENPEKAVLGTDDISGSSQVGADADNVFILWREQNGNAARLFTAKSRYKGADQIGGSVLQVDHETCTMSREVETTERQSRCSTPKRAIEAGNDIASNRIRYQTTPEEFGEFPEASYAPPLEDSGEQSDTDDQGPIISPDDKGPDI